MYDVAQVPARLWLPLLRHQASLMDRTASLLLPLFGYMDHVCLCITSVCLRPIRLLSSLALALVQGWTVPLHGDSTKASFRQCRWSPIELLPSLPSPCALDTTCISHLIAYFALGHPAYAAINLCACRKRALRFLRECMCGLIFLPSTSTQAQTKWMTCQSCRQVQLVHGC